MFERLLDKCGQHYILVLMILTRLFGSVAGLLVIYYVELTLHLPQPLREHFRLYSAVVVAFSCTMTVLIANWETRHVRLALKKLDDGVALDPAESRQAVHEAATFVRRHHLLEAWFVPCTTLVPDMLCLWLIDDAPMAVLTNLTVTVFMGIAMALMSTFFLLEHAMKPVIGRLVDHGVEVDFTTFPRGRLRLRFGISFALIILTTALMIGTLARQRASDIAEDPRNQQAAVQSLQTQSLIITALAVVVGVVYAVVLTDSMASRIGSLISAMQRVAKGDLTERLQPAGNDEVDALTNHFNSMVRELEHNDLTIRDFNLNLQDRVHERTRQLHAHVEMLKRAQAQLVQAEKLTSLGQLVAGVAHELNNAINAVYNGIQPLRAGLNRLAPLVSARNDGTAAEEEQTRIECELKMICKLAGVIENGASRTARIVQDLKTFSHPGREEAAAFDVHETLELCLNLLTSRLKNRVTVHKSYAAAGQVRGPKHQISQVFVNVLSNAEQAMPAGGEIWIASRDTEDGLSVSIRDSGPGIPPQIRDRVFDPFFTTKEPGVGTGLGLSISYGIMKRIGGGIECLGANGFGAEFVIHLPREPRELIGPIPDHEAHSPFSIEQVA